MLKGDGERGVVRLLDGAGDEKTSYGMRNRVDRRMEAQEWHEDDARSSCSRRQNHSSHSAEPQERVRQRFGV